jgi:hypothetical protein
VLCSKIEAGQLNSLCRITLSKASSCSAVEPFARAKQIALKIHVAPEPPQGHGTAHAGSSQSSRQRDQIHRHRRSTGSSLSRSKIPARAFPELIKLKAISGISAGRQFDHPQKGGTDLGLAILNGLTRCVVGSGRCKGAGAAGVAMSAPNTKLPRANAAASPHPEDAGGSSSRYLGGV